MKNFSIRLAAVFVFFAVVFLSPLSFAGDEEPNVYNPQTDKYTSMSGWFTSSSSIKASLSQSVWAGKPYNRVVEGRTYQCQDFYDISIAFNSFCGIGSWENWETGRVINSRYAENWGHTE